MVVSNQSGSAQPREAQTEVIWRRVSASAFTGLATTAGSGRSSGSAPSESDSEPRIRPITIPKPTTASTGSTAAASTTHESPDTAEP